MSTTPMFDPTGTVRMVPTEQMNAATQAGGQPAYKMTDPSGTPRWIHQQDIAAATQAGGKPFDADEAARIAAIAQPRQSTSTQPGTVTTSNGMKYTPIPSPQQQQPQATIAALPEPQGIDERISRWADNVAHDIKYGTDLTGVGTIMKKLGAHGVDMGTPEATSDFMASWLLGPLRALKGTGEISQPGQRWQGTKDIVGGAAQAGTIPAAMDAGAAIDPLAEGMATGWDLGKAGFKAAANKAAAAGRAAREAFTGEAAQAKVQEDLAQGIRSIIKGAANDRNVQLPDNIQSIRDVPAHLADALRTPPPATPTDAEAAATTQNELQKGIRSIIRDTGSEAGPLRDAAGNWIPQTEPESIRDVAHNLSEGLRGKASAMYKRLDDALGGTRFQAFGDNIRDLNETLRNTTNPEKEAQLMQSLRDEHARMNEALEQLKQQGVDPDLISEASATFRQHKGMEELSNNIRKTARGLRPELRQPGQEATPETIHADQLANRVNAMYDSGTLQDALGEGRAQDLLRHVDRAQLATPKTPAALRQQSDALDQVTKTVRKSAEGMRPEEVTPGRQGTRETLKVDQLFEDLHNLHDDGVLQEALGPQRARDLLNEVDQAKLREADVQRKVNRVKTGVKVGAYAAGGGAAAEGLRTGEHLLEGVFFNR